MIRRNLVNCILSLLVDYHTSSLATQDGDAHFSENADQPLLILKNKSWYLLRFT